MKVWSFIHEKLAENKKVMLIVVVDRMGSSPGVVGFKMAVSEDGDMTGSIGGGVMEYNLVELARKELKKESIKAFIKKQIHDPDAEGEKSGLICSGEQTHAFMPITKTESEIIKKIVVKLDIGDNGALTINRNGISFDEIKKLEENSNYQFIDENNWFYKEQIGLKPTLYIFGAGHVSVPLSQIFRAIDFKVVVFDSRNDLTTFENNTFAHRKEIIDFRKAAEYVPEGNNSYVVIMTVGHKSDELILEQFVNKELKYLGMIGSKNKVNNIYESLLNKGISKDKLAKVDAPIGLSINSKSTPEIAISIAAKVIQVKNC